MQDVMYREQRVGLDEKTILVLVKFSALWFDLNLGVSGALAHYQLMETRETYLHVLHKAGILSTYVICKWRGYLGSEDP